MEDQVLFRDYQEQQAQDHNDLQDYAQRSFDHLVFDAVSMAERLFAGFQVIKTGQVEVQISAGRLYDGPGGVGAPGAVYAINNVTTQSMALYTAAANRRYMLLTAAPTEVETDVEERDFLIDTNTGATEPRAVATTFSRRAQLSWTTGVESADPQRPAVPVGHVSIAYVLMDTTQVVSITMQDQNKVASTRELDGRTDDLETFEAQIGPRVASLASDIAAIQNRLNSLGNNASIQRIAEDVARVKESLRYPVTASDYGADFFLLPTKSDYNNTLTFGYDALVEEGLRFPDANADEFEIALFSSNDPNASMSWGGTGILLPRFTQIVKLNNWSGIPSVPESDLGMAQYGFQTVEMKQGYLSRTRLRFGGSRYVCSNGVNWNGAAGEPAPANLYDFSTWELITVGQYWWDINGSPHEYLRYDSYWVDTWKEPYIYAQTIDHNIMGAMIAQSFLNTNDMWATSVAFYVTAKGGAEDIHIALCELVAGVPDPMHTIAKVAHSQANIVTGFNIVSIPPTFLQKGKKYAMILVSNANHKVGMVAGQQYLDGTFFYSTDGVYYQGDLTKDLIFQVYGARFDSPQVTIEFQPINLDGGFRYVDILCEMFAPASTQLTWEMRPSGAGNWIPLTRDNATTLLATAPPLAQFRGRFDGTRDMMPALRLPGSRVHISRPKLAFNHVSNPIDFATAADEVHVKCLLEGFNETPHDHTCVIRTGTPAFLTVETADTVVTKLLDATAKRYERHYTFNLPANVSRIVVVQGGTTNTAQDTFHVAERTYFSQ